MVQQGVTNGGHPMQTQQPQPRHQGEIHEEYHDCGALWHCCVSFPPYGRVVPLRVTTGSVTPTIRPICISVAAVCHQNRHLYAMSMSTTSRTTKRYFRGRGSQTSPSIMVDASRIRANAPATFVCPLYESRKCCKSDQWPTTRDILHQLRQRDAGESRIHPPSRLLSHPVP